MDIGKYFDVKKTLKSTTRQQVTELYSDWITLQSIDIFKALRLTLMQDSETALFKETLLNTI